MKLVRLPQDGERVPPVECANLLNVPILTGLDEGVSFGFTRECPRGISLSRAGKQRPPGDLIPVGRDPSDRDLPDPGRRDFLVWRRQGASAALVPGAWRGLALPFAYAPDSRNLGSLGEFHLHPHYRAQLPLEATVLKTQTGLDKFITRNIRIRLRPSSRGGAQAF